MMNAPTNNAIAAKMRMSGWMKPSWSWMLFVASSRAESPVTACASALFGSALLMRLASCCWASSSSGVVLLPYTPMNWMLEVSSPSSCSTCWTKLGRARMRIAPSCVDGEVKIPETVISRASPSTMSFAVSPVLSPALSAVSSSSAIASSVCGYSPETKCAERQGSS